MFYRSSRCLRRRQKERYLQRIFNISGRTGSIRLPPMENLIMQPALADLWERRENMLLSF